MANLQIKSMDENLYKMLREKAKSDCRSIPQEVVSIIKSHLSKPSQSKFISATDTFLGLCENWYEEKDADSIIKDIKISKINFSRFKQEV